MISLAAIFKHNVVIASDEVPIGAGDFACELLILALLSLIRIFEELLSLLTHDRFPIFGITQ